MSDVIRPLHDADVFVGPNAFHGTIWMFHCPACGFGHWFAEGPWTWNGDREKPTARPSILNSFPDARCHLYMTDGYLQFLNDCQHALAGKSVAMEPEDA